MTALPPITGDRRWVGLLCLTVVAMGQAATMVVAAFTTRDVIGVLRVGEDAVPWKALLVLCAAGGGMFVLRSVEGPLAESTGQSFAAAIRRKLLLHMSRVPISSSIERRAGAMALRYVGDLGALRDWVSKGLARLISAAITIPAAFLILYLLHPSLAAGAALPIVAALLAILWLGGPLGGAHAKLRGARARLAADMAERLPQALALRRSGRLKIELRSLDDRSLAIARAATYRSWLTETIRGIPDIASGISAAICLWICLDQQLGVENAVAALAALSLLAWPLRRLAYVRDRQLAFAVASEKLQATLSTPTLAKKKPRPPRDSAPALEISNLALTDDGAPMTLKVSRGQSVRLVGPPGTGKSRLLTMVAGLEYVPAGRIRVLGRAPTAVSTGRVLYVGRFTPQLKGSLRRECTLGLPTVPNDTEIMYALEQAELMNLHDRLGGLSGQVAEDRRNLTSSECAGLQLVRGLLANPDLALIDADEIGLAGSMLHTLLDHLETRGSACLLVANDASMEARSLTSVALSSLAPDPSGESQQVAPKPCTRDRFRVQYARC